jgi:hypothetical protein
MDSGKAIAEKSNIMIKLTLAKDSNRKKPVNAKDFINSANK